MSRIRPVDASYLRRKVVQMHDRLGRGKRNVTSAAAMAAFESVQRLIDKTATLPVELQGTPPCVGCAWLGKRHQKCSCCRRNANMKDNFQPEGGTEDG